MRRRGKLTGHFQSLFIRYFLLAASLVVLPMLLLSIVYHAYYSNSLRQELESSNRYTAYKVRDMMDMVLSETRQLLTQICSSEELQLVVNYSSTPFVDYNAIKRYSSLLLQYSTKTITSEYIDSISVYSIPNDYVFSTLYFGSERKYSKDSAWIEVALEKLETEAMYVEERQSPHAAVLSFYGPCPLYGRHKNGVVMVSLDVKRLNDLITTINDGYFEQIVMADQDNRLVLGAESHDLDTFYRQSYAHLSEAGEQTAILKYDDVSYVVTIAESKSMSFRYMFATPVDVFEAKLDNLSRFMALVLLSALLLCLLVSYLFARKVYEPIKKLRELVVNKRGPAGEHKEVNSDELQYISENINLSFRRTDEIEQELEQRIALYQQAKAAALQAHINPHFIGNTLEAVNIMALRHFKADNDISRMVVSLSALIRYSMETESAFTTLREEISYSKEYISIQKERYVDKFEVVWQVKESCLDYKVLKVMLQPLLENAIYHGVKPAPGRCEILVEVQSIGTYLIIEINDNGAGMSQDALNKINSDLENEYIRRDRHIGLMNVNQRIKLLFGEEYGMLLMGGRNGRGIRVFLELPALPHNRVKE